MLRTLLVQFLERIAQNLGMKLVPEDEMKTLEGDLDRLREATDEVAKEMFVIIATGGPKRGTFTPIPIAYVRAIPRFPDEDIRGNRYSTLAPWTPYQDFVETIVPADRRGVSGLVVPKSTALAMGYRPDDGQDERTHRP